MAARRSPFGIAAAIVLAACTLPQKAPGGEEATPPQITGQNATPPTNGGGSTQAPTGGAPNQCGVGCDPDDPTPLTGLACAADGAGGHVFSCQVQRIAAVPVSVCALAGTADVGDTCTLQSDCSPGLACVTDSQTGGGHCRSYCCHGTCATAGTYCANVTRVDGNGAQALVPACVVATACTLLDATSCEAPEACAVVGTTTTCLTLGSGVDGEACPCAKDYVCLQSTLTCRHICHAGNNDVCPTGDICVSGGENFPQGFGVCSD